METFAPVSGMLVCVGGTGEYVKKEDYNHLSRRLDLAQDYIKEMDQVIDNFNVANSCINPLEDLKIAIAKLKTERDTYLSHLEGGIPPNAGYQYIIVNGQKFKYDLYQIGYEEIVKLANTGRTAIHSVTYFLRGDLHVFGRGYIDSHKGMLLPGEFIRCYSGMSFTAVVTDNA